MAILGTRVFSTIIHGLRVWGSMILEFLEFPRDSGRTSRGPISIRRMRSPKGDLFNPLHMDPPVYHTSRVFPKSEIRDPQPSTVNIIKSFHVITELDASNDDLSMEKPCSAIFAASYGFSCICRNKNEQEHGT